jgi:hypothetical protein
LLAAWEDGRDLVEIGAYQPGANAKLDEYMAKQAAIDDFLRQGVDHVEPAPVAWSRLRDVLEAPVPSTEPALAQTALGLAPPHPQPRSAEDFVHTAPPMLPVGPSGG